jgi:hypothetical protein
MTTPTRPRRKRSADKAARSRESQQKFWEDRFAATETPLDLVQETWAMLRARLVQLERKALLRVERAGSREQRLDAEQGLVKTRELIRAQCGAAAAEMARLADEIHTERR